MPMKQQGRKVYTSANGKQVDMDLLRQRNELTPAVGNARVNARGDELGPGGQIIRKKEEVLKDYYESQKGVINQAAVKKESKTVLDDAGKDVTDDWVEDEDGNFVQK